MHACVNGHAATVKALLGAGASVNEMDDPVQSTESEFSPFI
jgi:ankyrin repeat protein